MSVRKRVGIGIGIIILTTGVWAITCMLNKNRLLKSNNTRLQEQPKKIAGKKIILLPLGTNLPESFSEGIYRKIKSIVPVVALYPAEDMPQSAWYAPRNRYRADKLIALIAKRAGPNQVFAGITRYNISATKDHIKDWGVMGLGYKPGKACVSSDFRLKDKSAFWKVVIHELGHTTGLPHCPEKTCFMRDANGGDPTAEEKAFCTKCKAHLQQSGWQL